MILQPFQSTLQIPESLTFAYGRYAAITVSGPEWSSSCWCAVKKLFTRSLTWATHVHYIIVYDKSKSKNDKTFVSHKSKSHKHHHSKSVIAPTDMPHLIFGTSYLHRA